MGMMQVTLIVLLAAGAWAMLGLVMLGPLMFAEYRENAKRAGCRANLGSLGKALNMYSHSNGGKYPALADPATLGQGPIDEEPKFFGETTTVKGNGSVNAYYLLVAKGYADLDAFRCPSDDAYEAPLDRDKALGFNGWKNLSYALQPTSIDPAAFSSRPGPKSKVSMVIAADQVVDKATPLTTTDRPVRVGPAVLSQTKPRIVTSWATPNNHSARLMLSFNITTPPRIPPAIEAHRAATLATEPISVRVNPMSR